MANEIAFSDRGTKLYVKTTTNNVSSYTELVGIKSAPASGGEPSQIDVTELKSAIRQYIPDRVDSPNQNFTYNRTDEKFTAVSAVCDTAEHEFLLVYGDGAGTFIKGIASTYKNEVSSGTGLEATLVIVPSEIEDKTIAEVTALLPT
jgi:hypothetical protein